MTDLLDLIQDKKRVIKWLVDISDESQKAFEMLEKSREQIDEDTDLEKTNVHLRNTMLSLSKMSVNIFNLTQILTVYVSSQEFDSAIAKAMIKTGRGKEALSAMWKNKMKGKF